MPCGCTGSCLKLRAMKFDEIVRRVAILAECVENWLRGYEEYDFDVVPSGSNSDRLSEDSGSISDQISRSPHTGIEPKRSVRHPPKSTWSRSLGNDYSFLDSILKALAIDHTQTPLLKLERLPQIGLLFSDYLFDGTQSLGEVMKYHHNFYAGRIDDRTVTRIRLDRLVQRHRLPETRAFLHDLEVALLIQYKILEKITRMGVRPDLDELKRDIPESMWSPDSGYERVFFKTEDQHLGMGPGDLQEGDEVVVPFGSSRPWVLRSHGDHHVLVGEAFVPGIMTGQLEELWRRGDLEYTDYVLR
jgi:hypothetical protein